MRECVMVHYDPEKVIKELLEELPTLLEELFEEQGDSSPCSQIQRGVYFSSLFGRELLSLN